MHFPYLQIKQTSSGYNLKPILAIISRTKILFFAIITGRKKHYQIMDIFCLLGHQYYDKQFIF